MNAMKPGHAAAFALIGWYLMSPPMQGGWSHESAPLSQWEIIGSFDTAKECNMILQDDAESRATITTLATPEPLLRASAMACFATEDPRLKGK